MVNWVRQDVLVGARAPPLDKGFPVDMAVSLEAALDRRLCLFERLDALSRRQAALIELEDYEGLLVVVGEREEVVSEIVAFARGEGVALDDAARALAACSQVKREALQAKVNRLEALETAVADRDEADLAVLRGRRDAVAEQLRDVSAARSALGAYARRESTGPKFQDHEA